VPAVALSVEYIVFLGLTMRIEDFYSSWMVLALIAISFAGFLYETLIMGIDTLIWAAVPLGIFYLFAFGYLANERRKPREKAGARNAAH
jgi:hypothetical protein